MDYIKNILLDILSNVQSYIRWEIIESYAQSPYGDIQILYENSQYMKCFWISADNDVYLHQFEKKGKIITS